MLHSVVQPLGLVKKVGGGNGFEASKTVEDGSDLERSKRVGKDVAISEILYDVVFFRLRKKAQSPCVQASFESHCDCALL